MEQTDSCQRGGVGGDWLKEGEGISQRTGPMDVGNGMGLGEGVQAGWGCKGGKMG